MKTKQEQSSQIVIYTTPDGVTKLQVNLKDETVWLTQKQIATLFNKGRSTITEHIQNIYKEGELEEKLVCRNFRHTGSDFKEYLVQHYNLDIIISVGYRVKSLQGTQFRKWATQKIREYIIKGFAMDDDRLKQEGTRSRYFEELLQRIRDIRSSERNFYQKITDIYTTSIDYKLDKTITKDFFATVQNKIHYAVHGQTAAEMINSRVSIKKPFIGLTNFQGKYITTHDVTIAKNYLSEKELKELNLIVSMYLDFAELQASSGRLMKMIDWVQKLDDFLRASEKGILTTLGSVTHKQAVKKAHLAYSQYRKEQNQQYLSDFDREINKLIK